jgi:hypothetical protein
MFTLTATGFESQLTYDALISTMENYPDIARYVVGDIKFNIITSPVLPTEPYNKPAYSNEIFKGVVYGLAIGILLLLCYTALRTTIRTKKDIKANLNVKYIGVVPHIILKKTSKKEKAPLLITNKIPTADSPTASDPYEVSLKIFCRTIKRSLRSRALSQGKVKQPYAPI